MGIMTVGGVVAKEDLGVTTPHEHALIDIRLQYTGDRTPGSVGWDGKVAPQYYDTLMRDCYALRDNLLLDDRELAIREITLFANAGGKTFVDVTPDGIGRDVQFLKRLAEEIGMHVVTCSGYYTADAHPEWVRNASVAEIAEKMIRELTVGIDGTDIKAGIIGEIGTGTELDAEELRVLEASAVAHKCTGAPIMVHLSPWAKHGIFVLDLLENHGVKPESICLCHTDILLDTEYMQQLMDRGAYVEFDNFGKEFPIPCAYGRFPTDRERLEVFYQLIDAGYADKLLVSCDICLKKLLTAHEGPGYGYFVTKIAEQIRAHDDNAEEILEKVLVKNPARYLDNPRLD